MALIERAGREPVYDIEVEGTHNFVANGIIAHNTNLAAPALAVILGDSPGIRGLLDRAFGAEVRDRKLAGLRHFLDIDYAPKTEVFRQVDGLSDEDKIAEARRQLTENPDLMRQVSSQPLTLEQLLLLQDSLDRGASQHLLGRFPQEFLAGPEDFEEVWRPTLEENSAYRGKAARKWKIVYLMLWAAHLLDQALLSGETSNATPISGGAYPESGGGAGPAQQSRRDFLKGASALTGALAVGVGAGLSGDASKSQPPAIVTKASPRAQAEQRLRARQMASEAKLSQAIYGNPGSFAAQLRMAGTHEIVAGKLAIQTANELGREVLMERRTLDDVHVEILPKELGLWIPAMAKRVTRELQRSLPGEAPGTTKPALIRQFAELGITVQEPTPFVTDQELSAMLTVFQALRREAPELWAIAAVRTLELPALADISNRFQAWGGRGLIVFGPQHVVGLADRVPTFKTSSREAGREFVLVHEWAHNLEDHLPRHLMEKWWYTIYQGASFKPIDPDENRVGRFGHKAFEDTLAFYFLYRQRFAEMAQHHPSWKAQFEFFQSLFTPAGSGPAAELVGGAGAAGRAAEPPKEPAAAGGVEQSEPVPIPHNFVANGIVAHNSTLGAPVTEGTSEVGGALPALPPVSGGSHDEPAPPEPTPAPTPEGERPIVGARHEAGHPLGLAEHEIAALKYLLGDPVPPSPAQVVRELGLRINRGEFNGRELELARSWVEKLQLPLYLLYTEDGHAIWVRGKDAAVELGGNEKGGYLEKPFVGEVWITAGSYAYKVWTIQDDPHQYYIQQHDKSGRSALGQVHHQTFGQIFRAEQFQLNVVRDGSGKLTLTVRDLRSLGGTRVEWTEPPPPLSIWPVSPTEEKTSESRPAATGAEPPGGVAREEGPPPEAGAR